MRKLKAKWNALLLAVSCFAVCLGVGFAQVEQPVLSNTVMASAETVVRSMTKIAATAASSNTAIYFYAYSGDEAKSATDWDNQYTFVEGTGDGVKYNGETLTGYDMKQPGNDIYFGLGGKTAVAGDILTLDGTFRNETLDSNIVIDSGALTYNGSSWDRAYYTHELGEMVLSWPSKDTAHAKAGQLYITPSSGETVPYPDSTWSTAFTYESGDGLKKNGEALAIGEMKSVDTGFWFSFADVAVGDIVSISGTYSCATEEAKYVLSESKFQWNGSIWENYVETPEVTYTNVYENIDFIVHIHSTAGNANANNTTLWLYGTGDNSDAWAYYTCASGTGVKINGEAANVNIQDFGGGLYLKDFSVNTGDVITIGGTFVNDERLTKYVIIEKSFQWDGSGWSVYVPPVVYTEYTISNLQVANTSMAGGAYCANNVLSVSMEGGATVADWPWFIYESGAGFKVNGETAALTGGIANAVQDTSGGLYFQFAGVNSGDVVSIGGVFSNADLKIRYTIPESKFQWTGSGWETYGTYVEYTTYELGVIAPNANSTTFGAQSARCDHLYTEGVIALPVQDWEAPFALESGYGVQVNGEGISSYEIKSTEGGLWFGLSNIKAGDVVSICGTFKNGKHAVKYVIEESKMVWNGSTWEQYVDYTTYELGEMRVIATISNASSVYLTVASGETLPINSWDYRFLFLGDSGIGITLNGEQVITNDIKSPDGNMYISFNGKVAEEGAVLKIGGTFRNLDTASAYVIAESEFVYVDSVWKNKIDLVKEDACKALDEYKTNFTQDNYYEAEWNSFDTIISEGKANIDAATTNEEIETALAEAKVKMDNVVTKEESDAIFEGLKASTKEELAVYKNEADYRAAEWAAIQEILAQANTAIDTSESVTAINEAVDSAKAAMDAVKTNAQWEADEAVAANAKTELATYANEADYYEAEWAAIQAIITQANADIDNAIGNETTISEIVATAKTAIDAVKTTDEVDADVAVVAAAKAELATYANEADYYEAEWTAIQAIITAANANIDNEIGNEEKIAEIVESAKVDIDEVKTAKEVAKDAVKAYYGALDHDLYSEEAETEISGYVASVMQAIEDATTIAEMDAAIAQFKANVESVEKIQSSVDSSVEDENSDEDESSDEQKELFSCSSVITSGLTAGVVLGAAAVALLRKKKED